MRVLIKLYTAFFAAGLILLFSTHAAADDQISIEVRTIVATVEGDDFDSALEDLRDSLERGFKDYSSFRLIDDARHDVTRGQSAAFELPTEDTLTLAYHGPAGEFVKLGLTLGDRLSTTLRATPGSTFFQAGLSYEEGILILAITVE